jgi:serine/threonine protein kinase
VTPQNILIAGDTPDRSDHAAALQGDLTADPAGFFRDLAYMPPERTHGPGHPVDVRADIYSLGATMYSLFTGHPPFKGDTVQELVRKIRSDEPMSLKSHMLGVPETLEAINIQMLAKDPADRFQTARSLLKALENYAKTHNLPL